MPEVRADRFVKNLIAFFFLIKIAIVIYNVISSKFRFINVSHYKFAQMDGMFYPQMNIISDTMIQRLK